MQQMEQQHTVEKSKLQIVIRELESPAHTLDCGGYNCKPGYGINGCCAMGHSCVAFLDWLVPTGDCLDHNYLGHN